jgi:predicted nucleotidyltransferase
VTAISAAAAAVANKLSSLGVRYALVGGLAVSVRTEPRFTQDLDLAVAVTDDAGAEQVVHGLLRSSYTSVAVIEQEAQDRLSTVRLETPDGTQMVDLLFASSGIEAEIVAAAELLQVLPGLKLHVARTGHLIALKLLARDDETRPQDIADLRALRDVADEPELKLAREAVDLIDQRGFARGRDLNAAMAALLAE